MESGVISFASNLTSVNPASGTNIYIHYTSLCIVAMRVSDVQISKNCALTIHVSIKILDLYYT